VHVPGQGRWSWYTLIISLSDITEAECYSNPFNHKEIFVLHYNKFHLTFKSYAHCLVSEKERPVSKTFKVNEYNVLL